MFTRLPHASFLRRQSPDAAAPAWRGAAALALVTALASCTQQQIDEAFRRTVVVSYTLTTRCEDALIFWVAGDVDAGGVGVRGPALVYTIDEVNNQRPESTEFRFDPSKLFVGSDAQSRVFTGGPSTRVQIPRSGPIVVAPRSTWTGSEMVIIALDDAPIPANPSRALRYAFSPEQTVAMVGRAAPGGVRTEISCNATHLPAQSILQ